MLHKFGISAYKSFLGSFNIKHYTKSFSESLSLYFCIFLSWFLVSEFLHLKPQTNQPYNSVDSSGRSNSLEFAYRHLLGSSGNCSHLNRGEVIVLHFSPETACFHFSGTKPKGLKLRQAILSSAGLLIRPHLPKRALSAGTLSSITLLNPKIYLIHAGIK